MNIGTPQRIVISEPEVQLALVPPVVEPEHEKTPAPSR
jgi:hypothetical protein